MCYNASNRRRHSRHGYILKGFHHIDWLHLLRNKWVEPKVSDDGKKKEKRKDPLEQLVVLIKCVWDIFEAQWKCRNDILHSNDSALIERSSDTLMAQLLDFKRDSRTLLRSCDRFIIDNHSIQGVIKWPLQWKKATLDFLEHLHKIYNGELKDKTASYRDISSYLLNYQRTRRPRRRPMTTALTLVWNVISLTPACQALRSLPMMNWLDTLDNNASGVVVFLKVHLNLHNCHICAGFVAIYRLPAVQLCSFSR
jgi:hypothetical protein